MLMAEMLCITQLCAQESQIAIPEDTPVQENEKPTLYLIGDSTIKNGAGDGQDGMWGWGNYFHEYFDESKIKVANHALGGRSSRSFRREGLWEQVRSALKPGDFVIMQFGHNDGGPLDTGRARASLKGTGEETKEVTLEATGEQEVVYTYGWYMRQYIAETKAQGAIPIVCSLVPRNIWDDEGKVCRAADDYGKWAKESAETGGAYFIDLNEIVALKYDLFSGAGELKAKYFVEDHTHTNEAGARLNAASVISGLKTLTDCSLNEMYSPKGDEIEPASVVSDEQNETEMVP
ncbi:rhamnogalacturonan acetylesterase [Candidatus Sumerlaeota bacterium]|nr:rhamnogalacturonan acetylesterase [Candidatus Sumerlaeota bacterium]